MSRGAISRRRSGGGDTEAGNKGVPHSGVPTVADRIAHGRTAVFRAGGGTAVPSRSYGIGRSGRRWMRWLMPGAVWNTIGDRFGHSFVFDSLDHGPCPTSGVEAHGPPLGPPLCGAGLKATASTGGRHVGGVGAWDPQGSAMLARVGEPVSSTMRSCGACARDIHFDYTTIDISPTNARALCHIAS